MFGFSLRGNDHLGSLEVVWRGQLQRRLFSIPRICHHIPGSAKGRFVDNVERDSHESKLLGLLASSTDIYAQVLHLNYINCIGLELYFNSKFQELGAWCILSLFTAINFVMLVQYHTIGLNCEYSEDDEIKSCSDSGLRMADRMKTTIFVFLLACSVLALYTVLTIFVIRSPVNFYLVEIVSLRDYIRPFAATFTDPIMVYYSVLSIFIILSIDVVVLRPFLLLDIVVKFDTVKGVVEAVVYPWKQLLIAASVMFCIQFVTGFFVVSILIRFQQSNSVSHSFPTVSVLRF